MNDNEGKDVITAPWNVLQVDILNRRQKSRNFPTYMCGFRDKHPHNVGILIATRNGWRCPAYGCRYVQTWAYSTRES